MFGHIWILILVFIYGAWAKYALEDFLECYKAYKKGEFLPLYISTISFIVLHIIALFVTSLVCFLKGGN